MKLWIEGDTRPRPATAKMLGVYLAYYAIRHSLLVTYEAFEFIRTGHNSATFGDLVQNLKDTEAVLNKRFRGYQSFRASKLVLFQPNIAGEPPGSGPLIVTADYGGDTLIPKIPVSTEFDFRGGRLAIIREKWDATEFGKTMIPDLFKKYNQAYEGGLSLLGAT